MSKGSAIEWTDSTWNPVTGCTKVSPGCENCYAQTFAERFRGVKGHPFENGFDLTLRPERVNQPLTWKKPQRVFVNSMSDLFHRDVPDSFIINVFTTMNLASQHQFQVLTKRAERLVLLC
jgi:protein gp37